MNERYIINIFDFDPVKLSVRDFEITNCYKNKEKVQFAIQFNYPQNYGKNLILSGGRLD